MNTEGLLKWHRNYERTDAIGSYTSDQAKYVDSEGLFTISKFEGYDGQTLWSITRNEDSAVLDAMPNLKSAKAYCQDEYERSLFERLI